jgi:hypothetical protein
MIRAVRRVVFSPVVGLVVVLLVATGCLASKETREGANRLEDAIGTPSWATSVDVEASLSGLTDDEVETIVALKDEATADQVADFVLDHPDRVADADLGAGFAGLRFEASNDAALVVPPADPIDDDAVRAAVARWFAVAPLLGIGSTSELSQTTGGSAYTASVPGGAAEVAELFGRLRRDDTLAAPADSWSVSSVAGDLSISLAAPTLPTPADVTGWVALVDALKLLPPGYVATSLSMERFVPHAGVNLMLVMPDDVTRKNITPANYGDDLWPALQAQLRAVAGLRGGWSYLVQWAPREIPEYTTILLSLLDDQGPIDNHDPASLWSKQAKLYVDGL